MDKIKISDIVLQLDEGLSLDAGKLTVDLSWSLEKNTLLKGSSGKTYKVLCYGHNSTGKKFIAIYKEEFKNNIAEAFKLMALMSDLNIFTVFVLSNIKSRSKMYTEESTNRRIILVNEIRYKTKVDEEINSEIQNTHNINENSKFKSKKRDKVSLMVEILDEISVEGCRITNIIYKCNLNFRSGQKIINELISKGYIFSEELSTGVIYKITPSGTQFLASLKKYKELLK